MKLNKVSRNELTVVEDKKSFSMKSDIKVIKLMSDTLYERKHMSVFREIYSNCQDAQLMNKNKKPIDLIYWMHSCPEGISKVDIEFRDYGPGIDPDKIVDIYCTFFGSSKTETNGQIGGYGLGCKSPISICDKYIVKNYYNKKLYTYEIEYKDTLTISLIKTEDTEEDNGVSVRITFYELDSENLDFNFDELIYNYIPTMLATSLFRTRITGFMDNKLLYSEIFNPIRVKVFDDFYIGNSIQYNKIMTNMFVNIFDGNLVVHGRDKDGVASLYNESFDYNSRNIEVLLNASIPFDIKKEEFNNVNIKQSKGREDFIKSLIKIPEEKKFIEYSFGYRKITLVTSRRNYIYELIYFPVGTIDLGTSREYAQSTKENILKIEKMYDKINKFYENIKTSYSSVGKDYFKKSKECNLFYMNSLCQIGFFVTSDKETDDTIINVRIYESEEAKAIKNRKFKNVYNSFPTFGKIYENSEKMFKDIECIWATDYNSRFIKANYLGGRLDLSLNPLQDTDIMSVINNSTSREYEEFKELYQNKYEHRTSISDDVLLKINREKENIDSDLSLLFG